MTDLMFTEIMLEFAKLSARLDALEQPKVITNNLTIETMDKTDKGEGLTRFESSEALFEHLGIKDTCN